MNELEERNKYKQLAIEDLNAKVKYLSKLKIDILKLEMEMGLD